MCELLIEGGKRLKGAVCIQGSKNAALPIMAAALLSKEKCVIHNCPIISDTNTAAEILKYLGAEVKQQKNTVEICARSIVNTKIPKELMERMRSSIMFLGPLLARCKEATVCCPGGCNLGERPIDIHLKAFKRLGADINCEGECIFCKADSVTSAEIFMLYPSVGATENIMLYAASVGIKVKIYNAASEPEIVDLQNFLNLMGADIKGAGTGVITIYPAKDLHGCTYEIMPDRIVAATYACLVAAVGGDIKINGAEWGHMQTVLGALSEMGCNITIDNGEYICENNYSDSDVKANRSICISADKRCRGLDMIKTLPYPGFPTDVQPMMTAALCTAEGKSKVCETVFSNRFCYVYGLKKMGADIDIDKNTLKITGRPYLNGGCAEVKDLRGGAALVVAALAAQGQTRINKTKYIDRGYESIENDLTALGACIKRV